MLVVLVVVVPQTKSKGNLVRSYPTTTSMIAASPYPECLTRVFVAVSGFGGEAVFAKRCVCVRDRPQPSATGCNCLRVRHTALLMCKCIWRGGESVWACGAALFMALAEEMSWAPQLCKGGVSVTDTWSRTHHGVCRGVVCLSDLCNRSDDGVCREGVCVSSRWRRSYHGVCRGTV